MSFVGVYEMKDTVRMFLYNCCSPSCIHTRQLYQ